MITVRTLNETVNSVARSRTGQFRERKEEDMPDEDEDDRLSADIIGLKRAAFSAKTKVALKLTLPPLPFLHRLHFWG